MMLFFFNVQVYVYVCGWLRSDGDLSILNGDRLRWYTHSLLNVFSLFLEDKQLHGIIPCISAVRKSASCSMRERYPICSTQ